DGCAAHGWHVETHVLPRLGHFDDDEASRSAQLAGPQDGPVGALDGLDGEDGPLLDGDTLADIEPAHLLGHLPAEGDVGLFARGRRTARRNSGTHEQLRTKGEGAFKPQTIA